jgi:hypothetical protein
MSENSLEKPAQKRVLELYQVSEPKELNLDVFPLFKIKIERGDNKE